MFWLPKPNRSPCGRGTLRGEDDDKPASAKSGSLARDFSDRLAEARAAAAALAAWLPPD
jgi:hypothetical protein